MKMLAHTMISRVRYSYWFVPSLMVALAAGLAVLLGWVDERLAEGAADAVRWAYTGSPEGGRSLLTTVASSMITVAGVVFSVTIVALTLASSQFGPRLLRNFMRDVGNQVTLGMFVATFVYCLLVVRTIRGTDEARFVPHVSITVGIVLALLSLAVLIFFIHHVASSIQAPNVLAAVARDLERAIDARFPADMGRGARDHEVERDAPHGLLEGGAEVCAGRSGYVQAIDDDALLRAAAEADVVVSVVRRPGDFVVEGHVLARVTPKSRSEDALAERLRNAYVIDAERSVEQDLSFAVEQLVSVGVRALSPGMNDPLTAIQCIDWLDAAVTRLVRRRPPPACRLDDRGRPRVYARPLGLSDVLGTAFDLLRPTACAHPVIVARMLAMLEHVARSASRESDRVVLAEHARCLATQCRSALHGRDDAAVRVRFEAAMQAIGHAA